MKVLVVGGTRFVGLRLVRLLVASGNDVTLLNRGKTQAPLPLGLKRLYADRRDPVSVLQALSGRDYEAVFDFTGYDTRGIEPLIQALSGRIGHYVFQSTCGVYSESEIVPILESFPKAFDAPGNVPTGKYIIGKIQSEDYLLNANRSLGFPITIIRSPEIYGPENWMHEREFSFFLRLTQKRTILVPGDGKSLLHFVHVDDVAKAHLLAATRDASIGEVFNVAGPDAITIDGYIDLLAQSVNVTPVKKYLPIELLRKLDKPVFPFRSDRSVLYGINKAKDNLHFKPHFGITAGLQHTYEWWARNVGITGTHLEPGRNGCNVDLLYEEKITGII